MGLITIDAKHKIKRSTVPGVVPVIGASEDHTDGTWTNDMIYPGELFFNIPDQKVWIGINGGVLEIFSVATVYPSLAYADQPLTQQSRVITLKGNSTSDELVIERLDGDRIGYFTGTGTWFEKPVIVSDQLTAQDIVSNNTIDAFGWVTARQRLQANAVNAPITFDSIPGAPTVSGMWGFDASIGSTNYRMYMNAGTTAVNASTTVNIQAAGLDRLTVNTSGTWTRTGHTVAVAKGSAAHSTLEVNGSLAVNYKTTTTNVLLGINEHTMNCTTGTLNVILPSAIGIQGRRYTVLNSGSGVISITESSGQKINGNGTWYLPFNGAMVTVQSTGADWVVVSCKQRSTLNVVVAVAGATFQHNDLIGAKSISLIIRGGGLNQGPFTFNSATGTITTTVAVSDKLTVFYNPQ